MSGMVRGWLCALVGHSGETVVRWGPIRRLNDGWVTRLAEERCGRCDRILRESTAVLEGGRWRA